MTPEQALENLYKAARQVSATAEIHEVLAQSYAIVKDALPVVPVAPDAV